MPGYHCKEYNGRDSTKWETESAEKIDKLSNGVPRFDIP